MYRSSFEDLIYIQTVKIKKKYTNLHITLHHNFYKISKIYPENIIILGDFIFFFVNKSEIFNARLFIGAFRKKFQKKILIIPNEEKLLNLIHGLFPDTYIHDIRFDNERTITVCFLTWEDRGIAIGCNGNYIKTVNELFHKYINFQDSSICPYIRCELVDIYNQTIK